MNVATWLVRLYPRGWRRRYEVEMLALLEQHHITLLTILDLLLGAAAARMNPQYWPEPGLTVPNGLRSAAWVFLAACGVFVIFGQMAVLTIDQGMTLVLTGKPMVFWYPDLPMQNEQGILAMNYLVGGNLWHNESAIQLWVFFAITTAAVVGLLRWAVLSRHAGFTALTIIGFALPFAVELWVVIPLSGHASLTVGLYHFFHPVGIGFLTAFGELEAIMAVVLLSIIKAKRALITRSSRQLGLVVAVDFLLILISLYLVKTLNLFTFPITDYRQMYFDTYLFGLVASLLPFAVIGMLVLAVIGTEPSKHLWSCMLVAASLFWLVMVAVLVFFCAGSLFAWQGWANQLGMWFPVQQVPWFPGNFPVAVVGAALLGSLVIALAALVSMVRALTASAPALQRTT